MIFFFSMGYHTNIVSLCVCVCLYDLNKDLFNIFFSWLLNLFISYYCYSNRFCKVSKCCAYKTHLFFFFPFFLLTTSLSLSKHKMGCCISYEKVKNTYKKRDYTCINIPAVINNRSHLG